MQSELNTITPSESLFQESLQKSFVGGMNLLVDETAIGDNEYKLAFNLRNRFDKLTVIKNPTEIGTDLPGIKQGLYQVGSYLILFVAGQAYYKGLNDTTFTNIYGFQMSTTATRIYSCLVEASSLNYLRKSASTGIDGTQLQQSGTTENTTVEDTPRALLCQDGTNRPMLIFQAEDGTPTYREALDYTDWTLGGTREYVPIGLDMLMFNGILLLVSADRKKLYRSVTGRPLDFVVNVTTTGDKGGNADTTFYSVGYTNITSLAALNAEAFLVGTENYTYMVAARYDRTLFMEPTFSRQVVANTSPINSFSLVDILGDTAFIDSEGVKTFNAVSQLQNEGKNSPFTLKVAKAFENIVQESAKTCAISFDNYAIFSVHTNYGYVNLIYDTLTKSFSCFDMTEASKIKQFASLLPFGRKLFAITWDDRIFELFSSDTYPQATLFTKALIPDSPVKQQKLQYFMPVFSEVKANATVTCKSYIDGRLIDRTAKPIRKYGQGIPYVAYYPVTFQNNSSINRLTFTPSTNRNGWKASFTLSWGGGASLVQYTTFTHLENLENTVQQQALTY